MPSDTDPRAAWVDGFVRKYGEKHDLVAEDDDGSVRLSPTGAKLLGRAIKDTLAEDDGLKNLAPDQAAEKLLSNPRLYHSKVHSRMFGPSLVEVIAEDRRKRGLAHY